MAGTFEVFQKELADQLSSKRFLILFFLIYALTIGTAWTSIPIVLEGVKRISEKPMFLYLFTHSSPNVRLSFLQIVAFFCPIIGFMLTFESICREISIGTIYILVSQPIYRDSIIKGKFLAAFFIISIFLAIPIASVVGIGMIIIGIAPTITEIFRLIIFWGISVTYISFWAALGLLFSTLSDDSIMSLLASITVWFFLTVITYIIGGLLESFGVSYLILLRISPSYLFSQASVVILTPLLRFVGPISTEKLIGMVPTALSFSQSLSIVIPQLIFLVGGNFPLFLFSYIKFMRREIRQP